MLILLLPHFLFTIVLGEGRAFTAFFPHSVPNLHGRGHIQTPPEAHVHGHPHVYEPAPVYGQIPVQTHDPVHVTTSRFGFGPSRFENQPSLPHFNPVAQEPETPQVFAVVRSSLVPHSGNVVEKSKALAESAKSLFKSLQNITLVPELFDRVFELNGCLGSLEDAVKLMDLSNKLISRNAPEIIYLEAIVDNLMHEKNVTKLLRSSAKMLRILEDLIPRLSEADESFGICITHPKDSVNDFKALAQLMRNVINHRDIFLPEQQRLIIEESIKIMKDIGEFLVRMNKSLELFENLCKNNDTKEIAVYNSIGDIMEDLAALFKVLGDEEKAKDIIVQSKFIKDIVDSFRDVEEFKSKLECGVNGGYENLALTLDDLAEIVQNVGIHALAKEIGVNIDFINTV